MSEKDSFLRPNASSDVFRVLDKSVKFDQEGIDSIGNAKYGRDWPSVYLLYGKEEAYVGETQNAYNRMKQHSENPKRTENLENILLFTSPSFNKSAILDLENELITYMLADEKFTLQNNNRGQSRYHDYYQRLKYNEDCFNQVWNVLRKMKLANRHLYELQNEDIFKYSPFKQLTSEQYDLIDDLLKDIESSIVDGKRRTVMIEGGAGTGKTLVAVYLINLLTNFRDNNIDATDVDPDDYDEFGNARLIKLLQETKPKIRIALVEPVQSFRESLRRNVFSKIKELRGVEIISPYQATNGSYDILIVDEAHRLRVRSGAGASEYMAYDKACARLGFDKTATQLDWLDKVTSKTLILLYDPNQKVKRADIPHQVFEAFKTEKRESTSLKEYTLWSQLRVKGGNDYMEFVKALLGPYPRQYVVRDYDFKIYDHLTDMFVAIKEKNREMNGLCRVVAGKDFDWFKDKEPSDFTIEGKGYLWNKKAADSTFIHDDSNLDRIGCIDTAIGFDLNYCGVILGPDIAYDKANGKIVIRKEHLKDPSAASKDEKTVQDNIRNAYYVLLTRGIYGTYVYAMDEALRDYIRSLIKHS